jgi:hypothetical protein
MKKPKKKSAKRKKPKMVPRYGFPGTLKINPPAPSPQPAMPDLNGGKFATVRNVTLPELWCRIEVPVHVQFIEKMRPDATPENAPRKRPAMLARVHDLGDAAETKDLAMPVPLAALFAVIPLDGYVGRTYRITRHRRHERKNASGYSVDEIAPAETAP